MMKNQHFDIDVFLEGDTWIAINNLIPIATEAHSYDELLATVKLVAPEIAFENGLISSETDISFAFNRVEAVLPKTKVAA